MCYWVQSNSHDAYENYETPTNMDPTCLRSEQKMVKYLSNISRLSGGKRQHSLDKYHYQLLLQQTSMIYKPTDHEIKLYST